ncbi:SpoIIE family protein phosphatase [Streptomyces sp. NBC_01717]|uniref:SpoIIE family protein phosphatase n=1 Tax=Streptomyces sp. NBC_01717 TaxID=2975918 RepID=UPI002E356C44|nr:SpoIIE family protein phosphatase [Streptomyces sp. NBC_01717]
MATFFLDHQGMVTAWSAAAEKLLGYGTTETVGRPAAELWPEVFPGLLTEAREGRGVDCARRYSVSNVRWQGRRLEVAFLAFPLASDMPAGRGSMILAVAEPPMRRKEDQAILNGLFSQSPIGVAVYDTELRLVRMNAALERIQGLPSEAVLGRRLSELLPEMDTAAIESRLRRVLKTGVPMVDAVHRGRTPADPGRDHVWNVSSFALTGPDGRTLGVTDAVIDITDRYRARERLAFLDEAAARIGTTLDVTRTAEELVDVLVPRLADLAAIDLLDGVTVGEEPQPPASGSLALRLAARKASSPAFIEGLRRVGELQDFPAGSPYAQSLIDAHPQLVPVVDANADWIRNSRDPRVRALLEHGAHSLILVPLRARDVTLGFVHLYRMVPAEAFEHDDLLLTQDLVARAALCVDNARRYTREHTAAVALRESLLPRQVPEQSALDVAHCLISARAHPGVNGAWFGAVRLSSARVALAVGDVPGTGLQAATSMGLFLAAGRTLAELDLAPDELLSRLDDMVPRLTEGEHATALAPVVESLVGATCLYLVYDPVSRRCTMASAGHPPPVIVDPAGRFHVPELPSNKPLGVGNAVFEPLAIELAEGSTLLLSTHSLARACRTDPTLPARLRALLSEPGRTLDDSCQAIADIVQPHLATQDDLALLLVRTRSLPAERVATWDLPCDPAVVATTRSLVLRQLDQWDLGHLAFTTELIISELVTNAIRYGKEPLQLRLIHDQTLICEVSDASSTSPHIRRATPADEGGRGLFLVAQCSHSWGTRYGATGKTIWVEQLLAPTWDTLDLDEEPEGSPTEPLCITDETLGLTAV